MHTTNQYLNACADTWANCESLLLTLSLTQCSFSKRTMQVLDECANVCLGTMEAVKDGCKELSQLALLCVGLCEECAEICERYSDGQFQHCAQVCKRCSATLSHLAAEAA
ncbi:MAG: hypothetical protein JWP88_1131 [Flaviaesturariibacter sp.]|nr:hypothetical protein [Flaviaesturariibacter sp.]